MRASISSFLFEAYTITRSITCRHVMIHSMNKNTNERENAETFVEPPWRYFRRWFTVCWGWVSHGVIQPLPGKRRGLFQGLKSQLECPGNAAVRDLSCEVLGLPNGVYQIAHQQGDQRLEDLKNINLMGPRMQLIDGWWSNNSLHMMLWMTHVVALFLIHHWAFCPELALVLPSCFRLNRRRR